MKKEKLSIIISVIVVIISIIALLGVIYIINNDSKESNRNISPVNKEECCEGCICGDTIELLKYIETAWKLTEINSKGEYVYSKHSFINFHGTGKNKFAFFENDDEANTISEVRGEFEINKKNEIILTPSDNKNNIITCKIGEENDLIAVMYCDNDFGTFTLQKQGTIELPSIIIDTVAKTKAMIVKKYQSLDTKEEKYGYKKVKTITKEKEIDILLSVINNSKVWTGAVILPTPKYELELLDINNNSIATILYNPNFNIKINDKYYELTYIDGGLLETILA